MTEKPTPKPRPLKFICTVAKPTSEMAAAADRLAEAARDQNRAEREKRAAADVRAADALKRLAAAKAKPAEARKRLVEAERARKGMEVLEALQAELAAVEAEEDAGEVLKRLESEVEVAEAEAIALRRPGEWAEEQQFSEAMVRELKRGREREAKGEIERGRLAMKLEALGEAAAQNQAPASSTDAGDAENGGNGAAPKLGQPEGSPNDADMDALAAAAASNAKPKISRDIHEKLWKCCKALPDEWFQRLTLKPAHDDDNTRSRWLRAMMEGHVLERHGKGPSTRYRRR